MSSLYVEVDLGISSVINATNSTVKGQTTTTLGKFITAYDLNNEIYLRNRPSNNTISVRIKDNNTGLINTSEEYVYFLQLMFEKVA